MRLFTLLVFLINISGNLLSQVDSTEFPPIKIGEWEQHLPWQRSVYVTQSDSKVYFATEWAVVEIDKVDRTPHFITKVEGLSDAGINLIRYNKNVGALIIFSNSNLDLYYPADGAVLNLPIIKKNPTIIGDKRIYDIFFDGNIAYLACGFGLLKFDAELQRQNTPCSPMCRQRSGPLWWLHLGSYGRWVVQNSGER